MKRRQVIKGLFAVTAASMFPHSLNRSNEASALLTSSLTASTPDITPPLLDPIRDTERGTQNALAAPLYSLSSMPSVVEDGVSETNPEAFLASSSPTLTPNQSSALNDTVIPHYSKSRTLSGEWLDKMLHFDQNYTDDIYVSDTEKKLLLSVHLRLKKLQKTIGYGNFNVLGFDDALVFSKRFSDIGEFSKEELVFIDKIFHYDAKDYGFYGDKVIQQLASAIPKSHIFKVPYTGHYLFNEQSFTYYEKIRKSVGDGIILTSGIRSPVKQLHLFLAKVISVEGNYSRASRSLAPPGYSYHGIGDFDVGRKGWGHKNFTDAFSETTEFKRMQDLGYVAIRYDHGNNLGVRFEPWHIKVV